MSRQDANAAFARTSFLYGGNAAYIEDLYARYETDPASVDAEWRAFFAEPEGRRGRRRQERAAAPSWQRPNWPPRRTAIWSPRSTATGPRSKRRSATRSRPRRRPSGVELSAADVQQATRDSIRALMLIRAYRMRGHLHANLDPLGLEPRQERTRSSIRAPTASPTPTSTARSSSTTCSASNSRPCARSSPSCGAPIARRSASSSCTSPIAAQKGWIQERIEGPRQGDHLHPRGQARHPQQADRGRRLREIPRRQIHRHQALRPRRRRVADPGARADHQARRRARREGDRARHGASRPPQRAGAGDGQAVPRDLPRIQGRLVDARRRRRLRRREISSRRLVGPRVRRQQGASVADRQSVASRNRRSGGARQGARQAGPARRDAATTAPRCCRC